MVGNHKHISKSKINWEAKERIFGQKCGKETPKMTTEKCQEVARQRHFVRPLIELAKPVRTFGPKQQQALMQFVPGFAIFGLASLISIVYVAEWKAVLQYLPFYNGKYPPEN